MCVCAYILNMVFYGDVCSAILITFQPMPPTAHSRASDLLLPLQDGRERHALLPRGAKRGAQGDLSDFVIHLFLWAMASMTVLNVRYLIRNNAGITVP